MFDILGKMLDSVVMDSKRIGSAIDHMGTSQEKPIDLASIHDFWGKFFKFREDKYKNVKAVDVLLKYYLPKIVTNKKGEKYNIPNGEGKAFTIVVEKECKNSNLNQDTVITVVPLSYNTFPFHFSYKMKMHIKDLNGNVITTHYWEEHLHLGTHLTVEELLKIIVINANSEFDNINKGNYGYKSCPRQIFYITKKYITEYYGKNDLFYDCVPKKNILWSDIKEC